MKQRISKEQAKALVNELNGAFDWQEKLYREHGDSYLGSRNGIDYVIYDNP